jgi:hypothetical protein
VPQYLTDLEHNGVVRWNAASKKIESVITDTRLLWPDTLSWGPNGDLYVTASQIENMPRFNNGKSTRTEPYKLWKITGVEKPDLSQWVRIYGTRKIFPVYGSFTAVPGAKALTSM